MRQTNHNGLDRATRTDRTKADSVRMAAINQTSLLALICASALSGCAATPPPSQVAVAPVRAPAGLKAFTSPPESAAPSTYWYWISDNISRDGITKDLEVMKAVGIREAFIGNVDTNPDRRGPVTSLSPQWWGMVTHAMEEGARLNVGMGLFNSPGWSQSGGPWVKPEQAMRGLMVQEYEIAPGKPAPQRLVADKSDFQSVKLLAFPATPGRSNLATSARVTIDGRAISTLSDGNSESVERIVVGSDKDTFVQFAFPSSQVVRTLDVFPGDDSFFANMELEALDASGAWRALERFPVDRRVTWAALGYMNRGPISIRVPTTTSNTFRLRISRDAVQGPIVLSEIALREAPLVERYVEKQLGKMWQTPEASYDSYLWRSVGYPSEPKYTTPTSKILDITSQLKPDGTLEWKAPPGTWRLAWFGMVPTGAKNNPATPEATGLEVDKMSRTHLKAHYDAFIGKARSLLTPGARENFKLVIADSYEQGAQNWTDDMSDRFMARYHYDPTPYLPVLTGTIVNSSEQSDRFLWDLRRLVADLISTEYVGGLRDLAHASNMQLWLENYGHWGYPGEFLQYGGQSDQVGAEFWVNPETRADIEIPAAVSAARLYDKHRVSAEAYTNSGENDRWSLAPWSLKRLGDKATALGINHFVFHVNIHQPTDDKPGLGSWFGTEFNRNNTWFPEAKPWVDYLRRTHGVLQSGVPQAEVLYFIGEDTPKMQGPTMPKAPPGLSFDFVNAESLIKSVVVKDGRWVSPNGSSYRILVLPPIKTMTPALLEKLAAKTAEGALVYGPRPTHSPSLESGAAADGKIQILANAMWQNCGSAGIDRVSYGKGTVFCDGDLGAILTTSGVKPQIADIDEAKVRWIETATPDETVFFLSNQTPEPTVVAPTIRAAQSALEIWDPVTGTRKSIWAKQEEGRLKVSPFKLDSFQSVFLVASDNRDTSLATYVDTEGDLVADISTEWTVSFDPALGGPQSVKFPKLLDWTEHSEPGVRYYSGRATYRRSIDWSKPVKNQPVWLDLGKVRDLAIVTINGRRVGTVWTSPWKIDVSKHLTRGRNDVEIAVINTWSNRIIGDLRALEGSPRYAKVAAPELTASSQLQPAGILGPIRLIIGNAGQ